MLGSLPIRALTSSRARYRPDDQLLVELPAEACRLVQR